VWVLDGLPESMIVVKYDRKKEGGKIKEEEVGIVIKPNPNL
jgi:hypothetical protein